MKPSFALLLVVVAAIGLALAIASKKEAEQGVKPRTYRMGFSPIPPKMDMQSALKNLDEWGKRADGAIDHRDVPWKFMLEGGKPEEFLKKEVLDLMAAFRQKKYLIVCTVDPGDGIDRAKEAKPLREMNRSIAEPAVQKVYVDYVEAFARSVKPDYLGLGSEVNLLEANFPEKTKAGMLKMCAEAAERVKKVSPETKLYVSVQVDWAWGKLGNPKGNEGCEQIFKDFPYIQALGVSSYPAFGFAEPEQIPNDYYRKLLNGRKMPILMVEGGWPSTNTEPLKSNPEKQARWVKKLAQVLDDCDAKFVGLLMYADLDLSTYPMFQGTILPFFATMGLTDTGWKAKPALAEWDAVFKRPLAK